MLKKLAIHCEQIVNKFGKMNYTDAVDTKRKISLLPHSSLHSLLNIRTNRRNKMSDLLEEKLDKIERAIHELTTAVKENTEYTRRMYEESKEDYINGTVWIDDAKVPCRTEDFHGDNIREMCDRYTQSLLEKI